MNNAENLIRKRIKFNHSTIIFKELHELHELNGGKFYLAEITNDNSLKFTKVIHCQISLPKLVRTLQRVYSQNDKLPVPFTFCRQSFAKFYFIKTSSKLVKHFLKLLSMNN